MKVIIDCELHLQDSNSCIGRKLEIVGAPDEELQRGMVLLSTPEAALEVSASELRRALEAFK
jgi:hypothetical protein